MNSHSAPGLAIALGSSFLGYYAHAGFLSGLAEAEIIPERVSGASAGAIAGALFASGLRGNALEKAALDPALRWSFFDWGLVLRPPGITSGMLSGKREIRHLRGILGNTDLSTLAAPALEIAVTDALNHRPEILRRGPLAELVVASCAVPGLITQQQVGATRYIDGGVACEIPFEHWLEDDRVQTILIHRIVRENPPTIPRPTLFHSFEVVHRTVCGELHRHRRALALASGKRLIEIDTVTPAPALMTGRNSRACFEAGRAAAERAVAALSRQS